MKDKPRHAQPRPALPPSQGRGSRHPLDFLERMFSENDWDFSRPSVDSFHTITQADWTEYRLAFEWQRESRVLAIACSPVLTVPASLRPRLARLVASVNLEMWFGRFEFLPSPSQLQFRYGIPLYMLDDEFDAPEGEDTFESSFESSCDAACSARFCARIARLLESVLGVCERYYPAFRYALTEEEPSPDELRLAMSVVEGRA